MKGVSSTQSTERRRDGDTDINHMSPIRGIGPAGDNNQLLSSDLISL